MSDDREFIATLRLRMTATSLQNAARAAEAAADETDWVGKLDGVDDLEALVVQVSEQPGGDDG